MTSTLMAGKQKGRTVADYSADFQVEDSPASNGKGPHGKVERGRGAPGPGQPHWHAKQPKPTLSLSDCAGGDDAVAGGGPAGGGSATVTKPPSKDLDPHRVGQRQKQIDFGKNTLGYQRYLQQVPRQQRRKAVDPGTPDIGQNISKRAFDGQIKVWRRALHKYDTQAEEEDEEGPVARVVPFAQRRLQGCGDAPAAPEPSSPTNSNRSRGSLDGYVAPQADAGRKRPFQRAFDHVAGGNPHPSKMLTSPAGPKPSAPQSAPPATATDAGSVPAVAGRCADPPANERPAAARRGGHHPSSADAVAGAAAGLPKAPLTAPPAPTAPRPAVAGSTADEPAPAPRSRKSPLKLGGGDGEGAGAGGGEELFGEWDDEYYSGLEPFDDDELEGVAL